MAKALTLDEAKEQIYKLTKRLFELESEKKSEMKGYSEEDKELKNEIEATIEKKEQKAINDTEAKATVFEATKKRVDIGKNKRATAKEFKDEITDVTKEIFAIFDEQNQQNTAGTNP